jgi:alkanesulfonate monooxygenase SsuD/methylene tetrahydromethanopterin reductase-like flavin-dependent oxidoreductase (luciferase family)
MDPVTSIEACLRAQPTKLYHTGLRGTVSHPELGRSNQQYYEEVLAIADWAEELGFDSFWLGEHHLYWYEMCVSPPMIIAALGQRTTKICGPAVAVFPFHNPLVLAEEYALADNLCGGRLEFSVGSGFSPVEFQTFGMTMEEAKEKFWEAFEVILKAWTQEQFSYQGKHFQFQNVSLYLKPLQQPTPSIWMAASSDESLMKAGELELAMMGIPFARSNIIQDVQAKNDLYRISYFRAGHNGDPNIMVRCTSISTPTRKAPSAAAAPASSARLLYINPPSSGIESTESR